LELEHKHPSRRWTNLLKHRWPTVLGIAVAALTVFDLQSGTELVAITMLMPVVYLGAAALERVMNLGESRIEIRISRSAWFPRALCFPHS